MTERAHPDSSRPDQASSPSEAAAARGNEGGNPDPAPRKSVAQTAAGKSDQKPKPPALEDAPFDQFIPQHLIPALVAEIQSYGGEEPQLSFEAGAMPVVGSECWMVKGILPRRRRFWLCFTAPDIQSAKTIALDEGGGTPSLLESFLIDEKKTTLPLLVSRLVQRLNGQKWLGPN